MKYRKLRIAWSVGCGVLCMLLIALWMRSYQAEDRASGRVSSTGIRLYSSRGWLVLFKNSTPGAGPYDWDITTGSEYWLKPSDTRLQFALPLNFFGRPPASNISLPHWLVVLITLVIAAVPWVPHWQFRYSLRTLLIGMTLVAVLLGLAIVALRGS